MRLSAGAKTVSLLLLLVVMLAVIQGMGNYFIKQLSQFELQPPKENFAQDKPLLRKQTLRLETVEYYALQIGTFTDLTAGQHIIDELAAAGYRVFVTDTEPKHLWIGCFSSSEGMMAVPKIVQEKGEDIYVVKDFVNTCALSFPDDQIFCKTYLVPLVEQSDVLLKHSLKMFRSAAYQDYSGDLWQQQISRLQQEIEAICQATEAVLLVDDNQSLAKPLADYQVRLQEYSQSLDVLLEKKNDQGVLLAQSYLLEIISGYHQLINQANQCV